MMQKIGDIKLIKCLSALNEENIEVIFSVIVPAMPIKCYWIKEDQVRLPLMEILGEILREGRFEEVVKTPLKICDQCHFCK